MTERLTTLAAVKDWLSIETADSDTALTRIIDAASQFVLNWLSRDSFQARVYTQNFRGNGKNTTLLRNWPILSITSVGIGGTAIPASSAAVNGLPGNGYVVSDARAAPQSLDLYGWHFGYGVPSSVVYTAGFQTSQQVIIPPVGGDATYPTVTTTLGGSWSSDLGVSIDGIDAVQILTPEPTIGQYYVDEWGVYWFSPDDIGKLALIRYDYTPWDVNQAVTELIGEWYRRKDRIGVLSKTLGGQETITFSQKDMNESIRSALQFYNNVVPI